MSVVLEASMCWSAAILVLQFDMIVSFDIYLVFQMPIPCRSSRLIVDCVPPRLEEELDAGHLENVEEKSTGPMLESPGETFSSGMKVFAWRSRDLVISLFLVVNLWHGR